MKRIFFILLISYGLFHLQAQCDIDPNSAEGLTPNVAANLPVAVAGQAYSTTLQFRVPADTVTEIGTLPIVHIKIDSIQGLPANFSYQTNPSGSVFPGGSRGCILLTGSPTAEQIAASPNADGIYPIKVHFTGRVKVFFTTSDQSGIYEGYNIQVALTNSLEDSQIRSFSISQASPNPAHGNTNFVIQSALSGDIEFALYNMEGRSVMQRQIYAHQGEHAFQLDVSSLKAGLYMYTFRRGMTQVTQRLVVE